MKRSWLACLASLALTATLAVPALADDDISKVNGAIHVAAGQQAGDEAQGGAGFPARQRLGRRGEAA